MTTYKEIKNTSSLLNYLASSKEREIELFLNKLLDLKRDWIRNPSSINELRYNLALERYARLQIDTVDLSHLEQKIEEINNKAGMLRPESA